MLFEVYLNVFSEKKKDRLLSISDHHQSPGDQFDAANDERTLFQVNSTTEEAGHLTHDAPWLND